MIRSLITGIIIVAMFPACQDDVLVSESWTWNQQESWMIDDPKSMTIEAGDTTTVYKMDVKLKHDKTYPYQNLYIRTLTTFPSGKEVSSVTSLELIHRDGSWAGDCSGKTCTIELPLQKRFTFPEKGVYTWTVEPFMRMDTVPGIKSLSVICRKFRE